MFRIVESFFVKSAVEPADYPASAYPEFAFAGRSNVGKSSLINLLTERKGLAKTSGTPGKTRLLNFFLIRYKKDKTEESGFIQFTTSLVRICQEPKRAREMARDGEPLF